MELYFSPLACSMASRIALYEADVPGRFIAVDTRAGKLADGSNFLAINPMGQVPVIRTDDGELLTENAAVLQYIGDRKPESGLTPPQGRDRYRLQQWLNFITSELHKFVFMPLLDPRYPQEAKAYVLDKATQRMDYLNHHLEGRDYLLDRFSVADAYLVVVLNWARFVGPDLSKWPAIKRYVERIEARPSVARAMKEEMALFQEQQQRRAASR